MVLWRCYERSVRSVADAAQDLADTAVAEINQVHATRPLTREPDIRSVLENLHVLTLAQARLYRIASRARHDFDRIAGTMPAGVANPVVPTESLRRRLDEAISDLEFIHGLVVEERTAVDATRSRRTERFVERLTVTAAFAATMSIIVGFWGMNFEFFPATQPGHIQEGLVPGTERAWFWITLSVLSALLVAGVTWVTILWITNRETDRRRATRLQLYGDRRRVPE